ncbi:MAG: HpcH/HpaI aldolase family protein [Cognatishimia sp.]
MELPINQFKRRLKNGDQMQGVWNAIGGPIVPEILAVAGYDWILVDTEHSPLEVTGVLPVLQTIAAYPETSPIVRPAANDTVLIKRHLDLGIQTLLIPYVQNESEAKAAIAATRYPPEGVRGVSGLTRATRFGAIANYAQKVNEELCVILQVETLEAVSRIEAIATTKGVDAVFIGPADLAASMGYAGNPNHPEVADLVRSLITRLKELNVPSGILTTNPDFAQECKGLGVNFIASAVDAGLLSAALKADRAAF